MKCRCSGTSQVRAGEELQSDVLVDITDRHGNEIVKVSGLCHEFLQNGSSHVFTVICSLRRGSSKTSSSLVKD